MKKLGLKLENLRIESFDTLPAQPRVSGTVQGHQGTYNTCNETYETCAGTCQHTCDYSCNGTCYESCRGTCTGPSCNGTCAGQSTCGGMYCEPF